MEILQNNERSQASNVQTQFQRVPCTFPPSPDTDKDTEMDPSNFLIPVSGWAGHSKSGAWSSPRGHCTCPGCGCQPGATAPGTAPAPSPRQLAGSKRPRLPTSRWQTDTRPGELVGAGTSSKTSTTWAGAGREATTGCPQPPPPFWYGEADKGTSNQAWDSPRHRNSVMGKLEVQELPAWAERVQADALTAVQAQQRHRTPCPVPRTSRAPLSAHCALPSAPSPLPALLL